MGISNQINSVRQEQDRLQRQAIAQIKAMGLVKKTDRVVGRVVRKIGLMGKGQRLFGRFDGGLKLMVTVFSPTSMHVKYGMSGQALSFMIKNGRVSGNGITVSSPDLDMLIMAQAAKESLKGPFAPVKIGLRPVKEYDSLRC